VWRPYIGQIQRTLTLAKVAATLVLLEQAAEFLFMGVSLAEHPVVVITALGALGFPVPKKEPT
jgi:hypothetical protein